jgi:hypothetical protein
LSSFTLEIVKTIVSILAENHTLVCGSD